jgi:hypothetical protein
MHEPMSCKYLSATCAVALLFGLPIANATVTPVVNHYGNVFPVLIDRSLDSNRDSSAGSWYVDFSLTDPGNAGRGNSFPGTLPVLKTCANAAQLGFRIPK